LSAARRRRDVGDDRGAPLRSSRRADRLDQRRFVARRQHHVRTCADQGEDGCAAEAPTTACYERDSTIEYLAHA